MAHRARSVLHWAKALHLRDRMFYPVLAGLGVALFALQQAGGARRAEFDGHPDEAAQFVSGRMLWEYIRTLPHANPLSWAGQYYLHYPKVAIGHWPPGYHLMEAVWSLPFGSSRSSAIWLQWFLGVCALICLYTLLRPRFPGAITAVLLCFAIAAPAFQQGVEQTMSEPACLLCAVLFMHAMLRLMRRPTPAAICLVAASLLAAALIKGTAIALAPAPLLALAATRTKLELRPVWPFAAVMAAAALCAAWYFATTDVRHFGGINLRAAWPVGNLWEIAGWGLLGLAALGVRPAAFKEPKDPLTILASAMIVSAVAVSFLIRAMREPRHWIVILPAILVLAGSGLARFPRPVAVLLLAAAAGFFPWQWYRQTPAGYRDLIARLHLPARMLVSSSRGAAGEGGWIADVSSLERYPASFVVRATKLLAESGWNSEDYRLRTQTPADVLDQLDRLALDLVIVDRPSAAGPPHQLLLEQALTISPAWEICGNSGEVLAYCRRLPPSVPREPLVLVIAGRRIEERIGVR